jgi:hypothetical protein
MKQTSKPQVFNPQIETPKKVSIKYCSIDNLYYIERNNEVIHYQQTRPTQEDINEAIESDNWSARFKDMAEGKTIRISERIYYDMLNSVPPIKQTSTSFYCGEAYSGNTHHFFFKQKGKCYGHIKAIN